MSSVQQIVTGLESALQHAKKVSFYNMHFKTNHLLPELMKDMSPEDCKINSVYCYVNNKKYSYNEE